MKNKFIILWLAGVFSTVLALPYILTLQQGVIEESQMTLWQVGLLAVIQGAILLAVSIFFGLKLAQSINLFLFALLKTDSSRSDNIKKIIKLAVPLGFVLALVIKALDLLFVKNILELAAVAEQMPFWKSLTAAPYGGVVEELLMRLFFVSLFAWILGKITRLKDVVNNNVIMWLAIITSAIVFGLGHLPATATVVSLTPLVITRAISLNGIGGLVFGWLYWKKGLEYGIVAHFTTDIFLIAVIPALL